jgi:hypothetical protein
MAFLDAAIKASPCLAPNGSIGPQATQGCRPLPDVVARYRVAVRQAAETLAHAEKIESQASVEFSNVVKQAKDKLGAASPRD